MSFTYIYIYIYIYLILVSYRQGANIFYVGSEVLTAETVKSTILWDVMLCSSLTFWRPVLPPLSRDQLEASSKHVTRFLPGLLFHPDEGGGGLLPVYTLLVPPDGTSQENHTNEFFFIPVCSILLRNINKIYIYIYIYIWQISLYNGCNLICKLIEA
jgi:hypothetical protein